LAGKNEVAVEFTMPADSGDTGTNGALGGARAKGKKAGAGKDQLVEMRFYIPGVMDVTVDSDDEGAPEKKDGEVATKEENAATIFYETIMEKAEIGEVAGDTYITFTDVLHLTPRYVTSIFELIGTDVRQRTIRYRYVRKLFPIARQDIRLQDSIRCN